MSHSRSHLSAVLVAVVIATAFAVVSPHARATARPGINPVPCPQQEWEYGDPTFAALEGAKAFSGRYDGGVYEIEIPDRWNGELVLYAHGYVPAGGQNGSHLRVGKHPIREHLIEQGFAWAASSYRCNGYVPGQGLVDTMALVDLFTKSNNGRAPQRTYLTGTSMGGHVTILGLHQFPTAFAGGLAMCPAGPELFDFYAGVGAAAEVITGVQFHARELQQETAQMAAILGKPPDLTDKGRQLASVEIGISGGPRPFAVEGLAAGGRFLANISGGALAGVDSPQNRAVSTTQIAYDGALNARVRRKSGDPVYRSDRTPYDEVAPFDGKIDRPLLTMHGTGDLFVPIFLERRLKAAVDAAGESGLLTQRIYRVAGHCGFSQAEQIQAFDDLVKWVHGGPKPAGDNIDADLGDAGRAFTNPLRDGDPGHLDVSSTSPSPAQVAVGARVDFARDVQPIFRQYCYSCHGAAIHQNGFRLDRRADAMRGGTGSVIGGDSATSRLYMRVAGIRGYGPPMPPTGPLNAAQIDVIKRWIDEGAEWPDALAGDAPPRPTPPLMRAVLDRDPPAIRRLLDEHADVNAVNDAGATALMWAAMNLDAPTVKALIDHGANVNARSDDGRTALLIASRLHGALPIVTMLLDHGADPSVKAVGFGGDTTPLTEAAWAGELDTMRALVAKGADMKAAGFVALAFSLHANCRACFDLLLPAMDKQAITYAPLVLIAPEGDGRSIRPLIDRGADVGFVDGAGRSVLMRLVSGDMVPLDIVQTVIARGVDVNYANPKDGANALSLARLRGHTPVVDLLLKAGAHESSQRPAEIEAKRPFASWASPREAVEHSVPLLQESDVTFMKKTGCVSCHNNSLTVMAVSLARSHGVRVDEEIAQSQLDAIGSYLTGWRERALQDSGIPGDHDTVSSILVGLSAEGFPRNDTTDAMAQFILRQQMPDGRWIIAAHRPPIESNDIQVTANCIRALQVYAPPSHRAEYDAAIRRASEWLRRATPHVTEERAYQLLGYGWTQAAKATIHAAAKALVGEQRADGGWSQLPTLSSDAYATGEALVALEQSGAIGATDPAYRKGVAFLLKTQLADGSWYVRSRAIAIQPYFESKFPHGHDQFISAAATNWATMALAAAVR